MNKNILIGSIIAICILIGVSFTSVVGYRSLASDVKASPLFNIRSSRAIDEEREDLSCEYVGKNKGFTLSFPQRDNKIELVHKFIDNIRKMDDVTFSRFINLIIFKIHQSNEFKDLNVDEIVITLHRLKDNPDLIRVNYNRQGETLIADPSYCWFPGCIILSTLYYVIVWTTIVLLILVYWSLLTLNNECHLISLGLPSCNCN